MSSCDQYKMLRCDAQVKSLKVNNFLENINNINVYITTLIEKELDPCDMISMVFILYDVPDTALQRLIVYEQASRVNRENNLNLLSDWAQHDAQDCSTWKYKFLEALSICQLNRVIRKLGYNVKSVKKHFLLDNIQTSIYIDPMKKALYKLCDNMTKEHLEKLKNTLKTYEIDVSDYQTCELILLELMCKKFITIDNFNAEKSCTKYQVESLTKIICNLAGLQQFAEDIREIQRRHNSEITSSQQLASTASSSKHDTENNSGFEDCEGGKVTADDFQELFDYISNMQIEDTNLQNLKSDTKIMHQGVSVYAIKNPKRVGVCYIINQEDFHPSRESIESNTQSEPLEKRLGSNKDKIVLEKTMSTLNFEVITHTNIDHKKMREMLKNIIQYRVQPDDSMFMLCILSHGVRGCVYASDSVKVKIDDVQNLLDESFHQRQLEIPKIMILQACQVIYEEEQQVKLVADSPSNYYLRKLNYLIYWATAPELAAYRHETKGSLFIQLLCCTIQKYAKHEHLYDIFTKVTDIVAKVCKKLKRDQVPIFESTLRKKLFLQIPG